METAQSCQSSVLRRQKFVDVCTAANQFVKGPGPVRGIGGAVLDAGKKGFLRSGGSWIQTVGCAAPNVHGKAMLYADTTTDSMRHAIVETNRRRAKPMGFNEECGMTPESIVKSVDMALASITESDQVSVPIRLGPASRVQRTNLKA